MSLALSAKATIVRILVLAAMPLLVATPRLQAQFALDNFHPNVDGNINAIVVQPDGKILIGGLFSMLTPNGGPPVSRNNIARLNPDGTIDTGFDPNANAQVRVIVVQSDGKILIGGGFTTLSPNGGAAVTRNRIARLNSNGTLDTVFNPNASGLVRAIALQADGKVLVGGAFNGLNSIGGQSRNRIARLDATTGLADLFNPSATGQVNAVVVQADGKILVGGRFNGLNSIGSQTRNRIARLDPTTGLADSFDPNANAETDRIAVQSDGKILVTGAFNGASSIGGQTRSGIARLDPAAGAADTFNPNPDVPLVFALAIQPDGKILVGGDFGVIGGATRSRMARLDPVTGLADCFNPAPDGEIDAIALQPDGKILAGGFFTNIGGGARNFVARLVELLPVRATGISRSGSNIVVEFDALAERTYRLQRKNALTDANWQNIAAVSNVTPGTSGPAQLTDPNAISLGKAFYRPCIPGTPDCGWLTGDITTYDQTAWGYGPSPAAELLGNTFVDVYPSGLMVGGMNTATFTFASTLIPFLGSQTGAIGVLNEKVLNPDNTSAGPFASDVISLQLNVDFAEADHLPGVVDFGELFICNTTLTNLDGLTVKQFLAIANTILGGEPSPRFTLGEASAIAGALNTSFTDGTPSTFAQQNLFVGSCPCTQ